MSSDEQAPTKSSVYDGRHTHVTYFPICNTLPYVSIPRDQEWALPVDRSQEITASKTALKCRIHFKTFKVQSAHCSFDPLGYCDEYHSFGYYYHFFKASDGFPGLIEVKRWISVIKHMELVWGK